MKRTANRQESPSSGERMKINVELLKSRYRIAGAGLLTAVGQVNSLSCPLFFFRRFNFFFFFGKLLY